MLARPRSRTSPFVAQFVCAPAMISAQLITGAEGGLAGCSLRDGHVTGGRKIANYLGFIKSGPPSPAVQAATPK